MNALLARIKQHKTAVLVAGLLLLTVVVISVLRANHRNDGALSEPIKRGTIAESVYGIGTVTATRSFQLKTAVPSAIRRLYVKEGDRVSQGQLLVELQDVSLFRAPFAGTVTSLPLKVGETVFAQSVILELADLQDRYLTVSLEQRGAIRVRPGQQARISFENMRGETYQGMVESVYSRGNDFLVRIDVSKLPPQILPGMTADVAIEIATRKDALLVPAAAIDNGTVRVKRERAKPVSVPIQVGVVDGAVAEIVSGEISEGDRLVLPAANKK